MDWLELFSSSGYEFPLEVEPGSQFVGSPPFPDATVTAADLLYPRRILVQRLDLLAQDPGADRKERIRVYRIAIETEDGDLVEIKRLAVPAEDVAKVDASKCAGCGGKIPEGTHVEIDGLAYHQRCVEDGDGSEADSVRRGVGRSGSDSDVAAGHDFEGGQAEGDGDPSAAPPKTVTKTRSDDGISVSHMVTVTKVDGDRDIVTLWAREFESLSGTVLGRWSTGLFHGDLPKRSDAQYIDEKFFKGAGVVTASDLRVWNRLYKEAVHELHPPSER